VTSPEQPAQSRTWEPEEWEDDPRYESALDLLASGDKQSALLELKEVCEADPEHLHARQQLFHLALELHALEHVTPHLEWMIGLHAQRGETLEVCNVYRNTRMALPTLAWSEQSLVHALIEGDKARDGRIVVDATKMLLSGFPESAALARAFIASADVQLHEGRADLARATLQSVVTRFPLDPLAVVAERKLAELP
jgi:hypothetical protein